MDLVKRKSKGMKVVVREPEHGRVGDRKIVDLMEVLRDIEATD